jgi:outer membrane protein assembly factor BamB
LGAAPTTLADSTSATPAAGSWPKYLHDNSGSGTTSDSGLSGATAAQLKAVAGFPVQLGGHPVTTQPVLANGLIYAGGWDGYEYALHGDGSVAWKQYLGRTKNCFIADAVSTTTAGTTAGIVSTAAISNQRVDGRQRSVLYVGGGGNLDAAGAAVGGNAELDALDAISGQILWRAPLGVSPTHLIWSSPAVYQNSVYIGVSSFDDCPLIQGKLVKVDASTGKVQATFVTGPAGCETASIWGSPTVDPSTNSVYVATGNSRSCSVFGPKLGRYPHTKRGAILLVLALLGVLLAAFWPRGWIRLGFWLAATGALAAAAMGAFLLVGPTISINREYSVSVVQLDAGDLHVTASWKVPSTDNGDYDFGSTPTLFTGSVTPGGARRQLVGVVNKDGDYYVFDRANLAAGPVATIKVANAPETDPTKGNGSVAPGSFDGHLLYIGGGATELNGQLVPGNVAAYDPNNLSRPIWRVGTAGPVIGAISSTAGMVVIGDGPYTTVLSARDGSMLYQAAVQKPKAAVIFAAASIAGGRIYQPDTAGNLYAYGVNGQ